MLATDNELSPKEKAWFIAISKNYGASFRERSILNEYLQGRSKENLEEIISHIVDVNDKRRLLGFVHMAMRMDGLVRSSEVELFHKIQAALEPNLSNDYRELGKELIKRDRDIRAWKAVDRFGKVWSKNIPVIAVFGHYYYADGEFWASLIEIVSIYKRRILIAAALTLLCICLIVC